jgi:hypothetical protein
VHDDLLLVGLGEIIIEKLETLEHISTSVMRTFPVWFAYLVREMNGHDARFETRHYGQMLMGVIKQADDPLNLS